MWIGRFRRDSGPQSTVWLKHSSVVSCLSRCKAKSEINCDHASWSQKCHSLISALLNYHHVPVEITSLIQNIYSDSKVSIAMDKCNTKFIPVDRGVLQGDPSSPLLFNMCFIIRSCEHCHNQIRASRLHVGSKCWSIFQILAPIHRWHGYNIEKDVKSAQTLVNLNVAWRKWAGW